ncbi:TetR/AcrR family transcriptional regulator [Nguyenibacter vanlangensis]|uniref:TetR/AcrR family transcriptional regulator n=1 Tax=Nguyenibacter vanlangensis TaxID=1216886 RepID=A0ABZ3D9F4_9PROT
MAKPAVRRQTYHHGDLRAALIEAGLRLLADRAVDALSLREVARAVGVSATAVYRHFPDKDALLRTLAGEGLNRLARAQRAASDAAGGGSAGFAATGRAYVRFALANPALFRLIFASPCQDGVAGGAPEPEALALLRANAAASIGNDQDSDAARIASIRAWSLVHGLAMLMLDGQVPVDDALIEAVIDRGPRPMP